jgi:DNA-binding beta-propeller fold protein YncE
MKRAILISASLVLLAGCSDDPEPEPPCDQSIPGNLCIIAGSGENGYDANADTEVLPALEAKLSLPQDTLTSPEGPIYVADWNNHRIRSIHDGKIEWLAGRGELGGNLDDPANGDFNHPPDIIFDASGANIIIAAWHNSKIRTLSIDTGEIVDTCGDGRRAYFGDGGSALNAALDLPASVELDLNGDLIVMDQANQVLRRIDQNGDIYLVAGRCIVDAPPPGGPGACEEGVEPVQCPPDPNGLPSGKYTCGDPAEFCSQPCTPGYSGDEIPAAEMRMSQPFGQSATPAGRIAIDPDGNLYFADTANHLIRMIDTDGIVHRIAGQPPVDGVGQSGYDGDGGPAVDALINYPVDLELADDGTLFFADVYNHCVRKIDPDGIISTVAGICGERGTGEDGLPATETLLKLPYGVEWVDGRLHISDTGNNMIRTMLLP